MTKNSVAIPFEAMFFTIIFKEHYHLLPSLPSPHIYTQKLLQPTLVIGPAKTCLFDIFLFFQIIHYIDSK